MQPSESQKEKDPIRQARGRRSKQKGARQELRTRKFLENLGYSCARSSASLGLFDIIAVNKNEVKLVQVKSNRWPGTEETEQLKEFARDGCPKSCSVEIWVWADGKRLPRVKVL